MGPTSNNTELWEVLGLGHTRFAGVAPENTKSA